MYLALGAVALVLGGVGYRAIHVVQRWTESFHPPREHVARPEGLAAARDVSVRVSDGIVLRGWYVPSRNRAAVILGHGHGGQRGQLLPEAQALVQHGYGVLLLDWRAHGESDGTRTTWGAAEIRDFEAGIDFVASRPEVDTARIGAIGFSMGATIVALAAERDPRIRAVVLEGMYGSLEDMVRAEDRRWWDGAVALSTFRLAGVPLDSVRPIDALCRIAPRPLMLIIGERDVDIPEGSGPRLYDAACAPKTLWIMPHATHRTYATVGGDAYRQRLVAFFDSTLHVPRPTPAARARAAPRHAPDAGRRSE
jgi:dipeptidyl aminopeptidase/acylaminoacyl peptidase